MNRARVNFNDFFVFQRTFDQRLAPAGRIHPAAEIDAARIDPPNVRCFCAVFRQRPHLYFELV